MGSKGGPGGVRGCPGGVRGGSGGGPRGVQEGSGGGPGRKAAKTSKLKRRKRQEDPWGAGGKSGEIPWVLEP